MKKKYTKKKSIVPVILLIIFLGGIAGAGLYFQFNEDKSGNTLADELFGWKYPVTKFPKVGPEPTLLAYSDIRDPGGIPEGLPVRLKIPAIGVDSAIEDALITPDGRMDVPAGSINVAWFALGPHPGRVGSAVIGGHFGIRNGVPFVFYDLDKLIVGDKIYIEDDKGDTLAFQVRSIKLFDRNADATTIFTSDDGLAHLNLITCEGVWNRVNDSYPERRVVFTDAIPAEGAAVVSQPVITSARSLRTGARGADVTALQTALVQKGFLTMPRRVAYGYFGALTRGAVAKYQASVGLPPNGVFDSLTRTSFVAVAGKTAFPSTAILSSELLLVPDRLIQSVKSLFATPIDLLVTSLLLISIAFVSFKIIRYPALLSVRRPRR